MYLCLSRRIIITHSQKWSIQRYENLSWQDFGKLVFHQPQNGIVAEIGFFFIMYKAESSVEHTQGYSFIGNHEEKEDVNNVLQQGVYQKY